jgi:hypothetical protein
MQAQANGTLKNVLDPTRYAYAGFSMGGGGTLYAANVDRNASAILPLAPWYTGTNFTGIVSPMMIVSCTQDTVAENSRHSNVFYAKVQTPKAQVNVTGLHRCPMNIGDPTTVGRYVILWMKMYVQVDDRYKATFCAGGGGAVGLNSTVCATAVQRSFFRSVTDAGSGLHLSSVVLLCVSLLVVTIVL